VENHGISRPPPSLLSSLSIVILCILPLPLKGVPDSVGPGVLLVRFASEVFISVLSLLEEASLLAWCFFVLLFFFRLASFRLIFAVPCLGRSSSGLLTFCCLSVFGEVLFVSLFIFDGTLAEESGV